MCTTSGVLFSISSMSSRRPQTDSAQHLGFCDMCVCVYVIGDVVEIDAETCKLYRQPEYLPRLPNACVSSSSAALRVFLTGAALP